MNVAAELNCARTKFASPENFAVSNAVSPPNTTAEKDTWEFVEAVNFVPSKNASDANCAPVKSVTPSKVAPGVFTSPPRSAKETVRSNFA